MLINFKYSPMDYVVISVLDINYKGRIISCTFHGGDVKTYSVNYIDDKASFNTGSFNEDELSAS